MTEYGMQHTVITTVKPWWQSKTLWINGLTILAALIAMLIDMQAAGDLPFDLDGEWVAFVLAMVNFVMRWMTGQPLRK